MSTFAGANSIVSHPGQLSRLRLYWCSCYSVIGWYAAYKFETGIMSTWSRLFWLPLALVIAACSEQVPEKPLQYSNAPVGQNLPVYRLVPHPLYNPKTLSEVMQPLVDHLNLHLKGVRLELETSRDYQAFEAKFRAREAEILMPNPWQTIQAQKVGYKVLAMWGEAQDFKGIFIVRKDGTVKVPADLRGKAVSYPSPTALAAAIMPQYFLHQQGIKVSSEINNLYVGTQESSIMNVYMGTVAAGATWPPPWRKFQKDHAAEASQLKIIWETPPLVNNSVMMRSDLDPAIGQQITQMLLALPETPEGRKILERLETSRFGAANDASYDVVRDYIARFERDVRSIEQQP